MDTGDMMTSIPAWAIFVIIMSKMWLDWARAREAENPSNAPTQQEIAAVVRDQQERKEILDSLRNSHQSIDRVTESVDRVTESNDRVTEAMSVIAQAFVRLTEATIANGDAIANMHEDVRILRVAIKSNNGAA